MIVPNSGRVTDTLTEILPFAFDYNQRETQVMKIPHVYILTQAGKQIQVFISLLNDQRSLVVSISCSRHGDIPFSVLSFHSTGC